MSITSKSKKQMVRCISSAHDKIHDTDEVCPSAEWEDAYTHLREVLGMPADEPIPELSRGSPPTANVVLTDDTPSLSAETHSKRKAPEADEDVAMSTENEVSNTGDLAKKPKAKASGPPSSNGISNGGPTPSPQEAMLASAKAVATYVPFLTPEYLLPPKMPSHEEMEQFLLDLRKKALVEEYFGPDGQS